MLEYVRVNNLKPGDICAKNLYNDSTEVFLKEGTALSRSMIESLKLVGYKGIYIRHVGDLRREPVPVPEPLLDELLSIKLFFTAKNMYENRDVIYDAFDEKFLKDKLVLHQIIEEIVDALFQAEKENRLLFELEDQRSFNFWIYFHSVNVCMLSIGIAIKLGMSKQEVIEVALAAVYHDMGKARLDVQVVNKKDITEDERAILRNHPENMFRFLKKHGYSMNTLYGVWQHHEKPDGSGYPHGLDKNKIFKSASIIACADTYDHLINRTPYLGDPMYAAEAIEYMSANEEHDIDVLRAMFEVVVPYSVGTRVRLSNGTTAIVVKNVITHPLRPIIITQNGMVKLHMDPEYLSVTILGVEK